MKPRNSTPFRAHASITAAFSVAVLSHFAAPSACAVTSTWDGGYATTGTWNQASQWVGDVAFANNNDVVFNDVAGVSTVTTFLGSARTVNSITFNGGAATDPAFNIKLSDSGADTNAMNLTFKAANTGITVASADSAAHYIGTDGAGAFGNIVLLGNLSVAHSGAGTLSLNRPITGAFRVTKSGTGTLSLAGANTYEGTTLNQGTLTVGTGGTLGATTSSLIVSNTNSTAAGTAAILNLATAVDTTSGSLSGAIATPLSGANTATINNPTGRTFTVNQTAAGTYPGVVAGLGGLTLGSLSTNTLTLSGANTYTGTTTVTAGKLTVTGSTNQGTATSDVLIANTATGNAVLNIQGPMTARYLSVGGIAGASGAVNISTGGSFTSSTTDIELGFTFGAGTTTGGYGYLGMTGGTVNAARFQFGGQNVAAQNGVGVGLISGGTVNASAYIILARYGTTPGTIGSLTVATGGTLNHTAATAGRNLALGWQGAGRAELNLTGGTITSTSGRSLAYGGGGVLWTGTGIVNLDAGTLTTTSVTTQGTGASSYLNFNGGTLKAVSAQATFLPALTGVYVNGPFGSFTGGAVIDSNLVDISIGAALITPTGNGVATIPVTTGGSGYIGAPAVSITDGGSGFGATAIANMVDDGTGNGTFTINSITITNPGNDYTAPVANLDGGGNGVTAATLGTLTSAANTSGGLTKNSSGTLTLSGANTYTGPTLVSGGTLQLTGSAATTPTTSSVTVGSVGTLGFTAGTASTLNLAGKPLSLGGGTLAFDIGASGINDTLTVSNFTLTANSALTFNPIGAIPNGGSYTLLTSTTPITNSGPFTLTGQTFGKLTLTPTINTSTITIASTLSEGTWNQTGGGDWSLGNPSATSGNWDNYKPTVAGDAALFGSAITGPAAINVDLPHRVGYLRFDNANVVTIGSGASSNLTLDNGANIASVVVTSGSHVIAENVTLASNLFAIPATGTTLTVSGNLSGAGKSLQLLDAGTLVLSGTANSYTGTTTVNTGTLSLTGSLAGGGAVTVSGNGVLSESSTGAISGTTALTHSSSGTSTLSGANTYSGATNVTAGTLTLAAITGSITTAGNILLNVSGASAVSNIAGTYTSTGGGGVAVNSGGILNTSGAVAISGANNQAILLGTAGGSGTWNVTGGSVTVNYTSNGWGIGNGGVGSLNVSAGTVTTAATNVFNVGHGAGGTGILTVSATGLVNVNAGSGAFRIGANATSTGTVNLDGGSLALGRNVITVAGSTSTFNFNGGLLQAELSSATYMTGLTTANVRNNGAKIDTNSFNITIGQPLLHSAILGDNPTDGGLTKSGIGTLTLTGANTYTGPTAISGGTLQLESAAAVGPFTTSGISVGSSGALGFSAGTASILNLAATPLSLSGGALAADIGATGINDSVTVNNFTLAANSFATFSAIGPVTTGATYTLLTSVNPISNSGPFTITCQPIGKLNFTATVNTSTVTITPSLDESAWNQPGGGNWSVGGNWSSYLPTAAGDAALFGSAILAASTINVDSAQSVGYIRFDNANAYTIGSGTSNLTIDNGTSAASVVVTSGSHVIAENVTLASNLFVAPLTGTTLTVSGNVSGTGKTLQLSDAGTLVLSGTANSHTGTTTVSAGTLSLTGSLTGGGAINVAGSGVLNESSTGIISGATVLTHSSSGTSTLAGADTYTGRTTVNAGVLTLSGNRTATATGGFSVGTVTGSTGTLNVTNGTFTVGATAVSNFLVGNGTASTGIMNQSGGSLTTIGNQLLVGNGTATGTYNLSGGTLTTIAGGLGVTVGVNTGTTGTFNLSATGTLTMPATSTLQICRSDNNAASGVTGTFAQTGGTATVGILQMGGSSTTPANNANAIATLNLSAGSFTATTFNQLSGADNSSSTINISATADVTLPAFPTTRGAGATATINFDGGTLRPKAASATYMGGLTNAFIKAGGAKFDTTGFDITVTQDLLTHGVSTGGGLTKAGTNTLTLTGTNTYTGGSTITDGILSVTNASALGNGTVTFNGGTRLLVATGLNLANAIIIGANTGASSNGLIQAGAAAGTATVSGPITINNGAAGGGHFAAPTASTVLHLAGVITATVPNITQRIGTVVFSGGGTGYTGLSNTGTTIVGATDGIATSASVTIGVSAAGILDLNGFNQSLVGIAKGANAATIGNSSTTTDSRLTTTGTSSYDGVIQDVISPGTRKVALTVASGQLTLTGDSTFTGNIAVNGGKLSATGGPVANNSISGFGASLNTRTITVASGATLEFGTGNVFGGHNTLNVPDIIVNGGTITNDELVIVDPLLIKVNNALRNVTLNSGTITATEGNQNSNIDVVLRPGEGYGAWGLNGTVTSTGTSLINTGAVPAGKGNRILLSSNTADTIFDVVSGTLTVSAPLQTGESTPNYGLTKNGVGTLLLTAANIYTTNTTVNAGTLQLADNAQLKFVTGGTGVNNSITGAGTVTLDGDFNIDTTATDATALTAGSWILANTAAFSSSFTVLGGAWSEAANVWTKTVGSKKYSFAEATGILTLTPAGGYAAWKAINAPTGTPGDDYDGDGVTNAVEYVLGGTALTSDLSKLPTTSTSGGDLVFTFLRDQDSIDGTTRVSIQVGTTLLTWPSSYTVPETALANNPGVTVQKDIPAVGTDTVTLRVVQAPDVAKFARLVVTPAP